MSSVVAAWKGRCAHPSTRDALLQALLGIAQDHAERWDGPTPKRPAVSDKMAGLRAEGLPEEPRLRHWDREISGRILLRSDVARDQAAFAEALRQAGLPAMTSPHNARRFMHVRMERLRVKGFDFRFYDPRALYPAEDRFSCVFLQCEAFPYLDGLMANVSGPDRCARMTFDDSQGIEWYIECPFLHLRYFLEDWNIMLLSWMKYFFVPDLYYWQHDHLAGHEPHQTAFDAAVARLGRDDACSRVFDRIRAEFAAEVEAWHGGMSRR